MRDAEVVAAVVASDLSGLVVGLTTVVTVCVALMIWLGLLARATRASLLWTFALLLPLLGAYGALASAAMGTDVTQHPVAYGIAFGMPIVIWSGLRAAQGRRSYAWLGFAQSLASVAILLFTTELVGGFAAFRWLFFASAIGSALAAVEVLRGAFQGSRFGIPLSAASAALMLLGVVGVAGSIAGASAETDLLFLRGVTILTIVYVICATVSLLFLANRRPGAKDVLEAMDAFAPEALMRALVRERLVRARARGERTWSFIDFRLDDATDLREATGEAAFSSMARRFEAIVAGTFPAEADLCRVAPGHLTVFASQPPAAVREFVRTVLNEVAMTDADSPTTLRISASAGIAAVDPDADTYDTLSAAAGSVIEEAQRQGGDRWKRVEAR